MSAQFVACMEEVLELYEAPYDAKRPVVCFDETPKQLIAERRRAWPARPGVAMTYDSEYRRNGTCNLFLFCELKRGWRHIEVTARRAIPDFAHRMRWLVDVAYPQAERIEVVLDNLNTHKPASLYETFAPAEARRILRRIRFHYTPTHGSWLNMAEIEFAVLNKMCLDRRIPDVATLNTEIAAYEHERNQANATITWRFTSDNARIKLHNLYPSHLNG